MTFCRGLRYGLGALLVLAAGGCMPWVMGESARPVEPGKVRMGAGLGMLTPPYEPWRPLPVPQARLSVGLLEGVDGALSYAAPLTGHGRLRLGLRDGDGLAVAAAVGWGIHAVPAVAGLGEPFVVPFATGELQLSDGGPEPRWHGTLRGFVPYYLGDIPAATMWLAPQVGIVLAAGRTRWTPELGLVVPTVHAEQTQLVLGLGFRWGVGEPTEDGQEEPVSVP